MACGFGAQIISVSGTYDDAVVEAARRCADEGWVVLSGTSWAGYDDVPRLVMQSYGVIAVETLDVLPQPPTHIFAQAGVDGLACGLAGFLKAATSDERRHALGLSTASRVLLVNTEG